MPPANPRPPAGPKPGQFTAMISSTALDLPQHRAAVRDACLDAGVFPIGMENLPARDDSGIAVSLEMVDKADIYLGIYAWRYGWVPEGEDISITEMEFDRAVERKSAAQLQEILIFTAHDEHPFTKKDIETGDIPQQKLTAFKSRAATGRVRKEFRSVEELRRVVSDALHEFLRREQPEDTSGAVPEPKRLPSPIPNNLPRLQYFFGREKELQTIKEALAPDARGWGVLIDGPGGIGKTALAIRAAELVPEGRFQRIIFLSSKERELTADGQRSLGNFVLPGYLEMLNAIVREIGQADITKSPETERADAVNRALRDRDVLLVLDNLETLPEQDRDQLFAFLNRLPRGCSAITTSRRRADASAVAVRVDKLDWPAARDLMAEIGKTNDRLRGATEAQRRALHEETGGNPLLIRWVAGQLGLGRCRTVVSALDFLRNAPPGNDPLQFIFGDLLDTFSDNETKVVAALSYFTTPMEVKFIAELGGVSAQAAQTALESLSYRALVVPDAEDRQFVLVPTAGDFLRQACPDAVRDAGNQLRERAYQLIVEHGGAGHEPYSLLENAWPTIAPALPLFLTRHDDALQVVCVGVDKFLEFTGRWDELLFFQQHAELVAASAGDYLKAGWRAYNGTWVHQMRRDAERVLAGADRTEAYWNKAKAGASERSHVLQLRGLGLELKGDKAGALSVYLEALEIDRNDSENPRDFSIALNDVARVETVLGKYDAAERHFQEAIRVASEAKFADGVAAYTGRLADVSLARSDIRTAEALARQALPLSESLGRQELIAQNCRRLAEALARQGKQAEGLPYARRAVEIFTKLGSPNLKGALEVLAECGG